MVDLNDMAIAIGRIEEKIDNNTDKLNEMQPRIRVLEEAHWKVIGRTSMWGLMGSAIGSAVTWFLLFMGGGGKV